MGLLVRMGIRNVFLSFLEVIFFFGVSFAYFLLASGLYAAIVGKCLGPDGKLDVWSWFGLLPAWMWIVEAMGFLFLITVYWAPGSEEDNQTELRAFVLFLAVAAIAGLTALQIHGGFLTGLLDTYVGIFTGRS